MKSNNIALLSKVSLSYGEKIVLSGVSIGISEGEKIAFIGKSGVGKTTLLKKIHEAVSVDTAFIHQDFALVPQLSIFHNVYMGRLDHYSTWYNLVNLIYPMSKEVDEIKEITKKLHLDEFLHKRVEELSGGQKQRTAIGRAIFRGSNVLIADEPVSSTDPTNAENILSLLTEGDKTTVVSLHQVEFAKKYFTRIIGLKNQGILFDIPSDKLGDEHLNELFQ